MIVGDINSAITSLHEALTLSPADQIANELLNRALIANVDLTFEMRPDLQPDSDTATLLSDTDKLLAQRRANLGIQEEQPQATNTKKTHVRTRSSPRIARKLRFSKQVIHEDEEEDNMDTT